MMEERCTCRSDRVRWFELCAEADFSFKTGHHAASEATRFAQDADPLWRKRDPGRHHRHAPGPEAIRHRITHTHTEAENQRLL